jgi:hypothetical protein
VGIESRLGERNSADISGFALGSQTKPKRLELLENLAEIFGGCGCGAKHAPPGWAYFLTKIEAFVNAPPTRHLFAGKTDSINTAIFRRWRNHHRRFIERTAVASSELTLIGLTTVRDGDAVCIGRHLSRVTTAKQTATCEQQGYGNKHSELL